MVGIQARGATANGNTNIFGEGYTRVGEGLSLDLTPILYPEGVKGLSLGFQPQERTQSATRPEGAVEIT